ncbi:MAG: hypothetical protein RLZ92_168 [Pseudomonadota bacterium]|jgi:hypothetical protein
MKKNKVILVVLAMLFLSGCGDQIWCGEEGCNANSSMKTTFNSSKK